MPTKPHNYQRIGYHKMVEFGGRVLNSDHMGLGKTFQAWLYAYRQEIHPVLVICPAPLKQLWREEAMNHFGFFAEVLYGEKPPVIGGLAKPHPFLIINYEIVQYWMDFLIDVDPQLIIIDEGHYITNPDAKRTKMIKLLCSDAPNIIINTGTPVINSPKDLWPLLNILMPKQFPSMHTFCEEYTCAELEYGKWKYKGGKNLGRLNRILKEKCMIRRTAEDVADELPEFQRIITPAELERPEEYREAHDNFIVWLRSKYIAGKQTDPDGDQINELNRISALLMLVAELKAKYVMQWIENFINSCDDKLVVYTVHTEFLWNLYQRFNEIATVVDGSVTDGGTNGTMHRSNALAKFQHNDDCRILFGQIKAAGTGLNLVTAPASKRRVSAVAFAELWWNPATHRQAEKRIDRAADAIARGLTGQPPLRGYYLIARNTIEEKLCRIIEEKQKIAGAIVDGEDREWDRFSIYEELRQDLLTK